MDDILLRVHSEDLHDHVAQEVGECLESGLYTDLMIRCKEGNTLHAHKLVLSAASPFLRMILESNDWEDVQTLELPDADRDNVSLLLEVVYNGVVEATIEDLRRLILLAHSLYITIPLSDELMDTLELTLPKITPFVPRGIPRIKLRPNYQPIPAMPKQNQPMKAIPPKLPMLKLKLPLPQGMAEKKKSSIPGAYAGSTPSSSPEKSKKSEHVCPICKLKYSNIGNFKLHMKTHDNDHLKEQRNQMLSAIVASCYNSASSLYTCSICASTYNHSGNFKQHLLKHERESGSISAMLVDQNNQDPPAVVPSKNSHLSRALKSAIADRGHGNHGGKRALYNCEHCGKSFNHAGNFKQHLASHMRTSSSNGPSPTSQRQMKELIALQSSPKKRQKTSESSDLSSSFAVLTCPDCNLEFPNVDELDNHISSVHNDGYDQDNDSDQNPMTPVTMKKNVKLPKPKIKTYRCDQCPERFESVDQLYNHKMASHLADAVAEPVPINYEEYEDGRFVQWFPISDRKPGRPPITEPRIFTCDVCGKVFHKRRKLTSHVKIHSAPEEHYRFPCDICGKKFTRQQHVNRHKLLHTGERPFQCQSCNKTFAREDKYKYHVKTDCERNVNPEEFGIGHEMDDDVDMDNNESMDNGRDPLERPDDGDSEGEESSNQSRDVTTPNVVASD